MLTGIVLIYLQNVFDAIDHEILLQKHKTIRFSKGTLQWLRSYLSKQIFFDNTGSKLSDFGNIYCGPQSVRSTLLL